MTATRRHSPLQSVARTSSSGTVNFGGLLDGGQTLQINGHAEFDGIVGATPLTSLSVSGTTAMNAVTVTTSAAQTYTGAVTLDSGTTVNGVGITFGSTLNGGQTLAVNDSGITTFTGAVGGVTALTSVTTNGTGSTVINGGVVTTTGLQTYADAVTLGQNTTLSGTLLTFALLNSESGETNALAISGNAAFNGAVGGTDQLSSLSVSGTTALDGGSVLTTGNQTYSNTMTLGADATLTVGGNLSLAAVNGGSNLALAVTGTTMLNGNLALTSLDLDTAGPLAVNVDITTTGLLDLAVTDTASTGDNLTIVSGATLASTGGNIALAAGDNFTLQNGATLNANGTATITVDSGTVDVGTGATLTIAGTLTSTGATLTGGADADTFDILPQTGSTIAVNGGNPTAAPGDTLLMQLAAVTGTSLSVTAVRAGTFSFTSGHASVSFSDIESLSAVGGTFAVNPIDTGTGDDMIVLSRSGNDLVVTVGGAQYFRAAVASIAGGLVINGNTGDDSLTVDYSGGNPIPAGGLFYNGQGQTTGDMLQVSGGSFTNIIKTYANANDGTIDLDGNLITYTGLEPVLLNVGNVDNIIFNLPGGATDDNAILEDDMPTLVADTSRLRSQAGTATFETTTFTNPSNSLTVNMGASNGNFTIAALDSGFAAKSPDVTIHGEAGNDLLNLNARTGTGLYTFDGGADTDTLVGPNAAQTWNVTGADAGHINGTNVVVFDAVENLTGGTNNDTFVIATGGSVSGTITGNGGSDTLRQTDGTNLWNITAADAGNVTDVFAFTDIDNLTGGSGDDTFNIASGATLSGNLNGGAGSDTVVADDRWPECVGASTGTNSGTVTDLTTGTFTNIENLTGGSGVDTFTFATAGTLSGAIHAGAGLDEIIGDEDGNAFIVNAANAGVLTGKLSGFTSVENLTGQDADDTFTINANLTGSITGAGGLDTIVVAANVTVTGSIDAGAGNDSITLGANSTVTGTVNGGADSDTLLLQTIAADVGLTGLDAMGADGTATGITGGFTDLETIHAASGDTLTGLNESNTWALDGSPTYSDAGPEILNFSGFANLQGGTDTDEFNVTAATTANLKGGAGVDTFNIDAALTGTISGEGGADLLDLVTLVTAHVALTGSDADGFAGTATSVSGGFDGIRRLTGAASGTLTGENVASTWVLGAATTYMDAAQLLTFTGFSTLQGGTAADAFNVTENTTANLLGGAGSDTFVIAAGKTLTGNLNGQTDAANMDALSVATNNTAAVLSGADSTGFGGTITGVSGTFAGINKLHATGSGTEVLTGADLINVWDVDAGTVLTNSQTLTHTGFETLNGGSAMDTFGLSVDATASINGGGGNDTLQITADGVKLTGTFDGQAGTDTLDLSGYTSAVSTTLTAPGGTDGFNGTSTGIMTGTFANVDVIVSGTHTGDVLTGDDAVSTWALGSSQAYTSGGASVTFSAFETLTGGSAIDTFNVTADTSANLNGGAGAIADVFTIAAGATLTGNIDGEGGTDSLSLGDASANATVTSGAGTMVGYAGTASMIVGTFAGIRTLTGGGSGKLTGYDIDSTWELGATTTYTDGTNGPLTFTGFRTLQGGGTIDTFNVKAQDLASTLTIQGGDPNTVGSGDILHFNAQSNPVTAGPGTLSAGGTTITFSEIENVNVTGSLPTFTINGTGLNDTLTVRETLTNVTYQLTSGATLHPAVTLPVGVAIIFNGGDGDDKLIVDYAGAGGFFTTAITFHGGSQGTSGSDSIELLAATVDSVTHTFTNNNDGTITVSKANPDGGTAVVQYTGLEPITDNLLAAHRTFTFNGGEETITLGNHATAGKMTIDSTLGESVDFVNPTTSLTINAGSGDDMVNIASVDVAYRAALTIDGNAGADTITLDAALTLGSGLIVGNLTVTGETIKLNTNVDTTDGANNVTTAGSISLNGNVTLGANVTLTTDDGTDGSVVINGMVNSDGTSRLLAIDAGSGDVTMTGTVGGSAPLSGLTINDADDVSIAAVTTLDNGITIVTAGASPSVTLAGHLSTDGTGATNAGNISITGPVRLADNVVIDTNNATGNDGTVTFTGMASTINATTVGGQSLTIDSGTANTTLQAIGTVTPLGSLRVVAAGTIIANGNIVTRDNATIDLSGGMLQIAAVSFTLDTTGGGVNPAGADVILAAVNADAAASNRDLTITAGTSGIAKLTGALGGTRLDAVTITAGGGIELSGNITAGQDAGAVTFNNAVTLLAGISINTDSSNDGAVNFNSTLNGNFDLTIDAGSAAVRFSGAIGGLTRLGDGVGPALTLSAATGGVTFEELLRLASGFSSLVDATPITFNDDVQILAGDTGTTIAANALRMNGLTFTSAGAVTLGDDLTDVLTIDEAAVVIDTSAAGTAITVNAIVRANDDNETALSVSAGTGDVAFEAAIGDTMTKALRTLTISGRHVSVEQIGVSASTAADQTGVAGITSITASGTLTFDGTIYTTNAATYSATAFSINGGAAATVSTSGDAVSFLGGAITLADAASLTVQSTGGDVTTQAIRGTSSEDVTINAGAGSVSVGAIGSGNEMNTVAMTGSTITLAGNITTDNTAANTVTLTGAVVLATDVTIDTSANVAGDVNLSSTLNGGKHFRVNAGGTIGVGGTIGGTTPLNSLDLDGTTIGLASIGTATTAGVTGNTDINGTAAINFNGTVYHTNSATYTTLAGTPGNFNVLGGGAPVGFLTSDDALTFATGTIVLGDGADLTINARGGAVSILAGINGTSSEDVSIQSTGGTVNRVSVGAIGTANGINSMAIAAGQVRLSGNITTDNTAGNDVAITGATVMDSAIVITTNASAAGGNVTFNGPIDASGSFGLTVNTGTGASRTADVRVTGPIGANGSFQAPASLTISTNDVRFDSTVNVAGPIDIDTFNGGVVVLSNNVTTSGGGTLTITNAGALTVAVGANLNLDGSFTQNGAGVVSLGGNVTTTDDAVSFATAVTLTGNLTIATGGGAGDVTLGVTNGTAAGVQTLSIAAGTGSVTLGTIGGTVPLKSVQLLSASRSSYRYIVPDRRHLARHAGHLEQQPAGDFVRQCDRYSHAEWRCSDQRCADLLRHERQRCRSAHAAGDEHRDAVYQQPDVHAQ